MFLVVALVACFIYAALLQNWLWSFFAFCMLFISSIPTLCRRYLEIDLPYLFDIFICLSLLFHLGNGLFGFDLSIPLYNKFTHFFSSAVLAFLVLILLFVFNEYYRGIAVNRLKIFVDVVVITMALGVVWEFLEWGTDAMFGLHSQLGLTDTMGDLFADMLGGLFIGLIGMVLIQRRILQRFSKNFKKHFPELMDDE